MNGIMYVTADRAIEIMGNRRADTDLQKRLGQYVGENIPDGPFGLGIDGVPAVRAEYLARPTVGDIDFLETVVEAGLDPWTVTYLEDEYTDSNPKKSNMARPRLALPKGQIIKPKIVSSSGREIGSLWTEYGLTLQEWWSAVRTYVFTADQRRPDQAFDISSWYKTEAIQRGWERGSKADFYYPRLMGLYATRAVLFCNFEDFPDFTAARTGVKLAQEALGVDPIVVAWSPLRDYPAKYSDKYRIPECAVDLSDVEELNATNAKAWLEAEVFKNEKA